MTTKKTDEIEFIKIDKKMWNLLLKVFDIPNPICKFCGEKIKDIGSIMPNPNGDEPIILCKSPLCISEYFEWVDNQKKSKQKEQLKKEDVLLIEIKPSYVKNMYDMRIGDIRGSLELSNFSKKKILKHIDDELDKLRKGDDK